MSEATPKYDPGPPYGPTERTTYPNGVTVTRWAPAAPPAGWYTLRRTGPLSFPGWEIETVRLADPDYGLRLVVDAPAWLNAAEAAAAHAVALPAGLALVLTEPPRG